jgi:hypothetical protein
VIGPKRVKTQSLGQIEDVVQAGLMLAHNALPDLAQRTEAATS